MKTMLKSSTSLTVTMIVITFLRECCLKICFVREEYEFSLCIDHWPVGLSFWPVLIVIYAVVHR